jgi:hypothetical protein
MDPNLKACIDACRDCHDSCLASVMHCLTLGGPHADPLHVNLLLECTAVCSTTADLMLTNSRFYRQMCAVCARICTACAQQCQALGRMEECVRACERCADECEHMDVAAGEDA